MKREVEKLRPEEVVKEFPIDDLVEGWYFRVEEFANGAFRVEGVDLYRRRVSKSGHDPDRMLGECKAYALEIESHLQSPD